MGNLRVGYLHSALYDWLDGRGDIASFSCQFRQLNWRQDQLTTHATITGAAEVDGLHVVDLAVGVVNQNGEETTPGTAQVVLFDAADEPRMPAEPARAAIPTREPRRLPRRRDDRMAGQAARAAAVVAHRRQRHPALGAGRVLPRRAAAGALRRECGARRPVGRAGRARDFNPFAWNPDHHPEAYPWMRGMGTEPGYRGLNGGQSNWYFAPMRVGDVVTADVTLIDAFEKEGKVGTMMFLVDETRLTNQRGELVRITHRVSIYS